MPLILVCGLPQSGKTFWSTKLYEFLKAHIPPGKSVELVSEEACGADRSSSYANATEEKKARGNFISALERKITKDNIVIADGLNYIKGYRYQIYCLARAAGTPHCVLYCVSREDRCRQRNAESGTYDTAVLEELFLRFEEPNNQTRWDSPLFDVSEGCQPDWEGLLSCILGQTARPPSMATAIKTSFSGDLVRLLDQTTQEMVEKIMAQIRQMGVPTSIRFGDLSILIKRPILGSDLQRLRRQFIHMNRLYHSDPDNIEPLFAQYLENNIKLL